jgi:hypothetical protein
MGHILTELLGVVVAWPRFKVPEARVSPPPTVMQNP